MSSFANLVRTVGAAVVAGIPFGLASVALADAPQPLTFAQRVECQRRIERIRWMHRTESVAGQHRPFEETVPAELIRAKVETYLLQGEALARYWGRPLSAPQLQAEMERMARNTKAPDRLQELHSVLGDDPDVIAECLARPVLTERLIRNWYAYDTRFHGGVRAEAEGAIESAQGSIEALRTMGHAYAEELWERTGHSFSIHTESLPGWDDGLAADEIITVVVQINGKVRERLQLAADVTEEQAFEAAFASDRVKAYTDDTEIVRRIYVPGKLVNLVVR